ncbi:TonB family protein [Pyxidicoccus xibeiensis]|uniref:TonB family protein n=1 Tax=Pyxidicoccus xibeiensis TaxID=2906759 RepID=UPI0020A7FF93|nr:TonB family protein [Pyxidicoccus xibeiensis]MCP3139961.1 TonB family protein [Pyxidicoccus xibeiensis]
MTLGQRWRRRAPNARAVALVLGLLVPVFAVRAQEGGPLSDGGVPDAALVVEQAPRAAEVELLRTDAGWTVDTGAPAALDADADADADAGVAQAQPAFVPPSLVADSPAPYPPQLAAQGVAGVVKLELLIDEAGEVESATLVEALHPQMDRAALHAAPSLRFTPATMDGQPVQVRLFFEYRFEAPVPLAQADGGVAPEGPVTLRGLVRTKGNRRPIAGATLLSDVLPDAPVQTDAEGRFEARWPEGPHRVRVLAPGHKPFVFRESLKVKEALEVVYGLEPLVINPYETVVRGDRDRTEVSRITLHDAELREVPGTMGDPFRVVMLLPGVGSMLSGVAYPVVRGSQPASTGYFLDGIRVPILFHLFLGPAVIHPDFIDSIDFYPGTPPPKYGRLMGGAIDGRLSRPRDDRVHGSAYADLINAGFFIEKPFKDTGTSVSLAGRYSYTPWLIALAANSLQAPPAPGRENPKVVLDFWDYQGRVEQDVGKGKLRLFAFGSSDTFGTEAQDEFGDTALQSIIFHRVDLRHRHPVGPGELELGGTWGLDRFAVVSRNPPSDATEIYIDQGTWSARLGYTVPVSKRVALRAGADIDHKRAVVELVEQEGTPTPDIETAPVAIGTFMGAWAEVVWQPDDKWSVVPGLRVDNYHLAPNIDREALEPRLTVRHKLTDTLTLKGGAGLFHQPPTSLISLPVVDVGSLFLGLQEGVQVSMGAEWKAWKGLEVGLDVYVNPMLRTVELTPFSDEGLVDDVDGELPDDGELPGGARHVRANQQDDDDDDSGIPDRDDIDFPDFTSTGMAYGLELLIRHPLGDNWFGWLSYSLQRSTRQTRFKKYDWQGNVIGEDEKNLPFVFDQTHILNLVLSYKFSNSITLGGVFHFNTGRPESGALGTQTHREGSDRDNRDVWVRQNRDRVDRLPPFFRFDVRLSKAWVYDTFSLEAYADMLNATISQETVGFEYTGGDGRPLRKEAVGLPIVLPILGVKGRY